MMRKLGGLLLLTLAHGVLAAPQLLQGKVGQAAVVMELDIAKDGAVEGRYFYRKHHRDIALTGKQQADGSLQLGENLQYDEQRNDITLRPQNGGWVGEWHGPKAAKPVPVSLSAYPQAQWPASSDSALNPVRQRSGYDYARMVDLPLKAGKRERVQGYTLQWWDEPVSKIRLFRVVDGYPQASLQRINQLLAERQWQEVASYFDCQLGGARTAGADFEQTVTPRLLGSKLLSVSIFTSYYCGGAHPDFADNPLTLEVASGKPLQLEDLLWAGKGKPQLARKASGERADYQYEEKVLAPWLVSTMTRLYPAQTKPGKEDECDYRDPQVWQFVSWYATPQGLTLGPSFARVARACEYPEWSVLPWSVVKQHPGARPDLLP
ncbi:hypothetical protein [Aquitalea sp. USM4]|uniref:hypothetical protein n=1 Tax=Aquitalea sp. USM4 TaxID=1590041 RepID=UPI001F611B17|nr:hypothetical protein [Aquitalea sp. USM4]